jgi:hypothetical protein
MFFALTFASSTPLTVTPPTGANLIWQDSSLQMQSFHFLWDHPPSTSFLQFVIKPHGWQYGSGLGIEFKGLLDGGFIDALSHNRGLVRPLSTGLPTPLNYTQELGIFVWGYSYFGGVPFLRPLDAITVFEGDSGQTGTQISGPLMPPYWGDQFADNAYDVPWTASQYWFPALDQPPWMATARFSGVGHAAWKGNWLDAGAFSMTGAGNASWVGGANVGGAFSMTGAGSASWVGTGVVGGAFGMTGTGSASWVGTGVVGGAFSMTGAGSASWVGTGVVGGAFGMTGTGSASWVGTGVVGGAFGMTGTGSASWVGASILPGPSFVQSACGNGTTSANPSWGGVTTAGDFLVAVVACHATGGSTPVVSAPSGWTLAISNDLGFASGPRQHWHTEIWFKANAAAQSSTGAWALSTGTAQDFAVAVAEYSGLSATATTDKTAVNSNLLTTTADSGTTAATSFAAELVIAGFAIGDSSSNPLSSPTNGFTAGPQCNGGIGTVVSALLAKVTASTGAQNTGGTLAHTDPYCGAIATFH